MEDNEVRFECSTVEIEFIFEICGLYNILLPFFAFLLHKQINRFFTEGVCNYGVFLKFLYSSEKISW